MMRVTVLSSLVVLSAVCCACAGSSGFVVDERGAGHQFIRTVHNQIDVYTANENAVFPMDEVKRVVFGCRNNTDSSEGCLKYKTFNLLTGEEKEARGEARMIEFTDDVGPYRKCPKEARLLPYTYVFCPHCGERAVWAHAEGTPQGPEGGAANACEKCGFVTHVGLGRCPSCGISLKPPVTDTSRKTLDYLLWRAGHDPASWPS